VIAGRDLDPIVRAHQDLATILETDCAKSAFPGYDNGIFGLTCEKGYKCNKKRGPKRRCAQLRLTDAAADFFDAPALSFWERIGSRTAERMSLEPGGAFWMRVAAAEPSPFRRRSSCAHPALESPSPWLGSPRFFSRVPEPKNDLQKMARKTTGKKAFAAAANRN
jgi:hypothetical protein